jgi:NTE family protein
MRSGQRQSEQLQALEEKPPMPTKRPLKTTQGKRISLVLGSGGARGLAHIGVIRWLEEQGYDICSVSGCSMGALVGGAYAAGKLDEVEEWFCNIRKVDIVGLLDISWQKSGLVKGDKIMNALIELVGDQMIDDLPIAYTAVATDIVRQKEVWLQSGRLFDAIRASISLPMFFTPFRYNGVDLIDGGVLNPVPIAPAFSDHSDRIIAVSLSGEPQGHDKVETLDDLQAEKTASEKAEDDESIYDKVGEWLQPFLNGGAEENASNLTVYEVADLAFDSMQNSIGRQKLAAYPPDLLLEVASDACGSMEFDRAREMIDLGYRIASEKMPEHFK